MDVRQIANWTPDRPRVDVFLSLGGNLGDAQQTLVQAVAEIGGLAGVQLLECSALYVSEPLDSGGPRYVNGVVHIASTLNAPELLHALQAIELRAGRTRPYFNAPRTLDIDVLLYGEAIIQSAQLVVPHPRMRGRAFVLIPLAEIAPQCVNRADLAAVAKQGVWPLPRPAQAATLPAVASFQFSPSRVTP